MEASILAWERGESIKAPLFLDDVTFFEGVTGIELTDKNYIGVLPSKNDREHLREWTDWFEAHKQGLQVVCSADGAVSLRSFQGPGATKARPKLPPTKTDR
jgi:hypothetical protein